MKYEINYSQIDKIPVYKPAKIVAAGLNYKKHAHELDMQIPEEPVIFLKPISSIIGNEDNIVYPKGIGRLDYEAELACVIKNEIKNIEPENAKENILGYTCLNDVTARDLQKKDGQWTRAKSFDTFCPIGPCIEDNLDPFNVNIELLLNGKVKQSSNTSDCIFDIYLLVSFISKIMTLYPGDIITTGTPEGIGPMNIGDTVEVRIEGIGVLRNFVKNV